VRNVRPILPAVLTSLLAASSVAPAQAWYPHACRGGEDCGLADIFVETGENDWDQQLRAFDEHLKGLYAADKVAPSSSYKPVPPPEQMQSSMPVYQPEDVWDMTNRQVSRPRTSTRRSY
jgi:hypothetical protein